jgi:putative peptide zinc metalloprotease protein
MEEPMSPDSPSDVRPLDSALIRLRADLLAHPHYSGGSVEYYVLEDPVSKRFFRLGVAEYYLARQWDGGVSLAEAFERLSSSISQHRLVQDDAIALAHWLVEMDLATTEPSGEPRPISRLPSPSERKVRSWNPLSLRFSLAFPDAAFRRCFRSCDVLWSSWGFGLWVLLVSLGIASVGSGWPRFWDASQEVFAWHNGPVLFLVWLTLKILHEWAHVAACQRYGGIVHSVGIQCVWFMPMPFVDVTSCWRFANPWHRKVVALAGIQIELGVASLAAISWSMTGPGVGNHVAHQIVLLAGLSTILFNANPLMKLDGYYVLADWMGIPNLDQQGRHCVRGFLERSLLGLATIERRNSPSHAWWIFLYGWTSTLWRVGLSISLTVAAACMAGAAAAWVAVILAGLWLGPGLCQSLWRWRSDSSFNTVRLCVVGLSLCLVAVMLGLLARLPWPGRLAAVAVVDFSLTETIRASVSGHVHKVHVQAGQFVQPGDVLVTQFQPDLEAAAKILRLKIAQSEIRQRRYQTKAQLAARQAEEEQRQAWISELDTKEVQLRELTVLAPHAGRVEHPDLGSLEGRFLKAGDEILCVVRDEDKELRMAIAQPDLPRFSNQMETRVLIDLPGMPGIEGQFTKVIPRARSTPIHPALMSINGGTLPVRASSERSESFASTTETHELLVPHLEGIIKLDRQSSRQVMAGQRAVARFSGSSLSIGDCLYRWIVDWFAPERS